ncbi:hypothetical protein BC332_12795 [Capsicum chinense]|nr:hypothetical protein BC332_12795 [Capsicum chinense]
MVNDDGNGQLLVARKAALDMSTMRLVDIPEKVRKLLNLLESKDPRSFVASSHQGDSVLMEVPVMAFHGAFHDKTKEIGEAVSPSLELH